MERPDVAMLAALAIVAMAASPAWAACDGVPLKSGTQTVAVGERMRTFIVRAPSASDGRTPSPVVIAFHPFGTNAQYMAGRAPVSVTWSDAIVVYPNGTPGPGTGPGFAWQGRAGQLDDRDVRFFDAMLTWLAANGCVDERRVFVLGYSNGAGLAYLLACERANRIAGVAIVSGRMDCTPGGARPIIISHGVADATIEYGRAVDAARIWSEKNGCHPPPPPARGPGCVAAAGCTSPVTLCTHEGGHEYDGSFTRAAVEFFKSVRVP